MVNIPPEVSFVGGLPGLVTIQKAIENGHL